jgi:hypothetical protein
MKNNRIIKFISLVLLVLVIFQMIPGSINCTECFQSHVQNSKVSILSGTFHSDVLFISRAGQKTVIQKLQLSNNLIFKLQVINDNTPSFKFSSMEKPYDKRSVIRQSIPHYFSGSKYKENNFVI